MPTYQNDSSENIVVLNASGVQTTLEPGDSSTTNRYYDITNLTKTSDEPFLNPVAGFHTVDITGVDTESVELSSPDINKVRITPTSGTLNVFYEDVTNTPAVVAGATGTDSFDVWVNGVCDKIVIQTVLASGGCTVQELKGRMLL